MDVALGRLVAIPFTGAATFGFAVTGRLFTDPLLPDADISRYIKDVISRRYSLWTP